MAAHRHVRHLLHRRYAAAVTPLPYLFMHDLHASIGVWVPEIRDEGLWGTFTFDDTDTDTGRRVHAVDVRVHSETVDRVHASGSPKKPMLRESPAHIYAATLRECSQITTGFQSVPHSELVRSSGRKVWSAVKAPRSEDLARVAASRHRRRP